MQRPMDTVTFEVDFNDVDKDGQLLASMRFAHGAVRFPQPGERVVAHDSEGNQCEGTVYSYEGLIVKITLNMATWTHSKIVITNAFDQVVVDVNQTTQGPITLWTSRTP